MRPVETRHPRQAAVEKRAHPLAGTAQPRLLRRERDSELLRHLRPRVLLEIAQHVHGSILRLQLRDGLLQENLQSLPAQHDLWRWRLVGRLAAMSARVGEPHDRRERFTALQLPAHAAPNRGEPRAERRVLPELLQALVRFEHGLHEHVLRVLAIPAGPNELPINGILVRGREGVEVGHDSYHWAGVIREAFHAAAADTGDT